MLIELVIIAVVTVLVVVVVVLSSVVLVVVLAMIEYCSSESIGSSGRKIIDCGNCISEWSTPRCENSSQMTIPLQSHKQNRS